jgi:4-diphosphocytidyl-2-C-methyl-D-erythritol kinase
MISFAPCKINLGLNIVGKRADGYHDIETCFYPVPWMDIVEVIKATEFGFSASGLRIPGTAKENLVVRAYEVINEDFHTGPVRIHLHKVIPFGAGLGGGSSDAAHIILLLNTIFTLGLNTEQLFDYASRLGSDCAFFIQSQPMTGTGRGDQLSPLKVNLKNKYLVIVKPDVHVPTAAAYAGVHPAKPVASCADVVSSLPVNQWKNHLKNDFEETISVTYPEIRNIRESLYEAGASYAAMSGSGSAVFGIFDEPAVLISDFQRYQTWKGMLSV